MVDARRPASYAGGGALRAAGRQQPRAAVRQRGTLTNATQVWGVADDEARDLVYASDMNSGLWILRRTDR